MFWITGLFALFLQGQPTPSGLGPEPVLQLNQAIFTLAYYRQQAEEWAAVVATPDAQPGAWLEKEAVSAEQYRHWQSVLRQSRSLLQSSPAAAPPPRLQQQLQASFRAKHPISSSGRNRWKGIAIAASLAAAFWVGRHSSPEPEITLPEPMVEIRHETDTVYLERVVERTVYLERPAAPRALASDPDTMSLDMPDLLPVAAAPPPAPAGRTAKDDARLLDMAVEVY